LDGREAHAVIMGDGLDVDGFLVLWLDVDEVVEGDHRVRLDRADAPPVELTHLGAGFDRFMRDLRAARGMVRRAAMVQATGEPIDSYLARDPSGLVDVHLFADGLVVEPRTGPPSFFPLPLLQRIERDDHALTLRLRGLPSTTLSGFGARTDEVVLDVERARQDLQGVTTQAYAVLDPALAGLGAPDGWALTAADARSLWPALRSLALNGHRKEAVQVLADRAGDALRVGVWTDGGQVAMPFVLAPAGGRVAVEATDADDRATFVFATDDVEWLNAALLVTNFRREVLASDEAELGRWAVAVRTLAIVRDLRAALVARVVHDAAWAERVAEALHG